MLVTVDDHHDVVSAETRWLDVVRWETCQLDVRAPVTATRGSAFPCQADPAPPRCDDRLLALRVDVRGATKAHASLTSHATHWTSEFRQAALDTGAVASGSRRFCSGRRHSVV